jgi:NAD(P)-dependent dehydrogenase (short-subunit alcohol dehydrogenase family)
MRLEGRARVHTLAQAAFRARELGLAYRAGHASTLTTTMASGLWSAEHGALICRAMTNHKNEKPEPGRRKVIAAVVVWAKSYLPGQGRMAHAEEIAAFALTLGSDEHPYLTGAAHVVDGGKTAHAG